MYTVAVNWIFCIQKTVLQITFIVPLPPPPDSSEKLSRFEFLEVDRLQTTDEQSFNPIYDNSFKKFCCAGSAY